MNGLFSEEILLGQGVRQGCPISPLLFGLATQPFMDYMHSLLTSDNLLGIRVSELQVISFKFFADDLGMLILATPKAFHKAQATIHTYKMASKSKINLQKFTIIPFNISHRTPWLQNIGCIISEPETMHKYLGVHWGANLHPNQFFTFYMDKVASRISSWSSHYLYFASQTLLIKHILQAIPTY